ncbi:hypothetical protein SAMN04487894_10384 [Niabella drilacis]|uniref:Uncharacterized protein n=1 Tax=Niabella drilacis (strain DSM 25811 / CCM 8410 / CCUG 62505 / LMG 26954 / E90) TaxID=1285928 RepID=A0A1G6MYH2_NIADE|nr:hypothetical protein SAMN04487894_10384 [Niabella drilacis]
MPQAGGKVEVRTVLMFREPPALPVDTIFCLLTSAPVQECPLHFSLAIRRLFVVYNKPASKLFLFSVSEDTDRGVGRGLCPHKPLVITHFNKIDPGSLLRILFCL